MTRLKLQAFMYRNPAVAVCAFILTMGACVLGMGIWKATATRDAVLSRALSHHRKAVFEGGADAECAWLQHHLAGLDLGQVEYLIE